DDPPPNVVVIFLESVSYPATSLSGSANAARTPALERLAAEGVEFACTRVPVPLTSKGIWSALTGSTPDIYPDYAEAVHSDQPYESLVTVLESQGYRSAFFEMSKGSFECAPGFFANVGFDWAWFRENLGDESAYIGSLNGDDFRAVGPMFEWVDRGGAQPFVLVTISTVAHAPYQVPRWYDETPQPDRYLRYLRAVEFTDAWVAEILAQLESRGLAENTIVCVLGDHGEAFRPECRRSRAIPYEEVIRIPWVVRWPAKLAGGQRVERNCSQMDVAPTILGLLGFGVSEAGFHGRDALAALTADAAAERRLYFSSWYLDSPIGYVEGQRKFVYWPYTDAL
ncbi:MAG: LTA synthase family protein, partial [Gemmatimonadetes bacterium]|nr:LTA synthase family protein [Gemmatimonadota bacterium]